MADIDKVTRVLKLYQQLYSGKRIEKAQYCIENGISGRTFDRDIEDIRLFLSESYSAQELCYIREDKTYMLTRTAGRTLSGEEAVVLGNLLMSVKDFQAEEMEGMMRGLIQATESSRRDVVAAIFQRWKGMYKKNVENKALMKLQWDITVAIMNRMKIRLNYEKADGEKVVREILPMEIVYDDGFGYLIAYRADCTYKYPAFFKLNRILSFAFSGGTYLQEVKEAYVKLELQSYLKFMQGGSLENITVRCTKEKRKIVEDSFRIVKVITENEKETVLEIQCFSQGFFQWVMGQEPGIEVLEPYYLREKLKETYTKMLEVYKEGYDSGKKS